MENYEDLIEESIVNILKYRFGLNSKDLTMYLYLRYLCIYEDKNIDKNKENIIDFIIKETGIELLEFNGVKINKSVAVNNSIANIIDNFIFRLSIMKCKYSIKEDSLFKICNELYDEINKKAKKYYKQIKDNKVRIYYRLKELNYLFLVEPKEIIKVEGFLYNEEFDFRSIEEKLEIYIDRLIDDGLINNHIYEKILQGYISRNLNLLEDGLKLIGKEFLINNESKERIDILAKDKDNNFVIIELKVKEDKKLLWQCVNYKEELEKIKGSNNVRVITLCPSYSKDMLKNLSKYSYINKYIYELKSKNKEIKNMEIKKL